MTADALLDGELALLGRVTAASNATFLAQVARPGGEPVRCVYKPVRGEQPLWDFPDGTLAGREVASYLVSEALGWGLVPPTAHRDGPFGPGMVQLWVRTPHNSALDGGVPGAAAEVPEVVDVFPGDEVPGGWLPVLRAQDEGGRAVTLAHADDPRLLALAVLDVVLNNTDRKGGHILTALDGGLYGVDHGICLHAQDKLRTVLWGWAGRPVPAPLLADLARLRDAAAGAWGEGLAGLVTAAEVGALVGRLDRLLSAAVMPAPAGRNPIPWPAF